MIYAVYAGGPGASLFLIADPDTEDREYWVFSDYDPPGAVYHGHVGVQSFRPQTDSRMSRRERESINNEIVAMAGRADRVEHLPEDWGMEEADGQDPVDFGRRVRCPRCRRMRGAAILYGLPAFSAELEAALARGTIVIGGCCVTDHDPRWRCARCGHEWGDTSRALVPVPPPGTAWNRACDDLALSFDGYAYRPDLTEWADARARSFRRSHRISSRLMLDDLRALFFFEQRRAHWNGAPEGEYLAYAQALLDAIRSMAASVEMGEGCPFS